MLGIAGENCWLGFGGNVLISFILRLQREGGLLQILITYKKDSIMKPLVMRMRERETFFAENN